MPSRREKRQPAPDVSLASIPRPEGEDEPQKERVTKKMTALAMRRVGQQPLGSSRKKPRPMSARMRKRQQARLATGEAFTDQMERKLDRRKSKNKAVKQRSSDWDTINEASQLKDA